jgi:hypothetical protein
MEAEEKTRSGTMFIGYPRKPREELGSSERVSQCVGVARENQRKKNLTADITRVSLLFGIALPHLRG